MIQYRLLALWMSFMLVACADNKVKIKPKGAYLPEAIIGKPYRQVIHVNYSIPYLTSVKIWPEDAGFYWRFSHTDSTYWQKWGIRSDRLYWNKQEAGQGDAIEIIGIPNTSLQKEIKISIWALAYSDMFHLGADSYKEYIIKRVPDAATSVAKP